MEKGAKTSTPAGFSVFVILAPMLSTEIMHNGRLPSLDSPLTASSLA